MNVLLRAQFVKVQSIFCQIKRQTAIDGIASGESSPQNDRHSKTMTTISVSL